MDTQHPAQFLVVLLGLVDFLSAVLDIHESYTLQLRDQRLWGRKSRSFEGILVTHVTACLFATLAFFALMVLFVLASLSGDSLNLLLTLAVDVSLLSREVLKEGYSCWLAFATAVYQFTGFTLSVFSYGTRYTTLLRIGFTTMRTGSFMGWVTLAIQSYPHTTQTVPAALVSFAGFSMVCFAFWNIFHISNCDLVSLSQVNIWVFLSCSVSTKVLFIMKSAAPTARSRFAGLRLPCAAPDQVLKEGNCRWLYDQGKGIGRQGSRTLSA
ncbi:uncharacterized protein PAC_05596 [Phialocephala subalpina]|uniref:Uncharacterized protein n=1 Tax=Phialocephala subalpina TaxID=576137 RepID=A0A1L7WSF8_9HELO|nr:uncharacterized protein PAC_05596 [Phialocephala subalpina]